MLRNLFYDPISALLSLLYTLPALVVGFTVHECCHALAAVALGDDLPRHQGRLTLNPAAHIDPLGMLLFVLLGFGYARPVQINISRIKFRKWGEVLVSLAGPFSNFIIALLCFVLAVHLPTGVWTSFLSYGVSVNLVLTFLNLLPVPPLDGFSIVRAALPASAYGFVSKVQNVGIVLLLVLSFTGVLSGYLSFMSNLSYALFAWVV